jgi:hypothetical protein
MEDFFRAVTGTQKFQYGLRRNPLPRIVGLPLQIAGSMVILTVKKAYHGKVSCVSAL